MTLYDMRRQLCSGPSRLVFKHLNQFQRGAAAHFPVWHMHSGQGRCGNSGKFDVVKPGYRNVIWNSQAHLACLVQCAYC